MFDKSAKAIDAYMDAKYGKRERKEVTLDEFVKICVASGMTEDKAKRHAKISSIMRSEVVVGDYILVIKSGKE